MSPRAFGHTGFTGTSLWIDPSAGIYVAFLTNRVHPSRDREGFASVRPAVHDAVMAALG
jgi:CubicO group peptidase (beta-lactamase class C family)